MDFHTGHVLRKVSKKVLSSLSDDYMLMDSQAEVLKLLSKTKQEVDDKYLNGFYFPWTGNQGCYAQQEF